MQQLLLIRLWPRASPKPIAVSRRKAANRCYTTSSCEWPLHRIPRIHDQGVFPSGGVPVSPRAEWPECARRVARASEDVLHTVPTDTHTTLSTFRGLTQPRLRRRQRIGSRNCPKKPPIPKRPIMRNRALEWGGGNSRSAYHMADSFCCFGRPDLETQVGCENECCFSQTVLSQRGMAALGGRRVRMYRRAEIDSFAPATPQTSWTNIPDKPTISTTATT
jgi:hypothetical protein